MTRFLAPCILALTLAFAAGLPLGAQVGRREGMIDPNLATEAELRALPNVTEAIARIIVARRPFLTMAEFDAAISPSLTRDARAELYRRAFVPLNLNTASREEILLIPGVGARMLREFNEYRPYKALAQFHREIGKYVNAAELARLEQYVYVPIDINTARDEDILTIPGVGPRMLREFKEYRPWKNSAHFRREIGKYVSDKEVARLERYIVIGGPQTSSGIQVQKP